MDRQGGLGGWLFAPDAQRPLGRWWPRGGSAAADRPRVQVPHLCRGHSFPAKKREQVGNATASHVELVARRGYQRPEVRNPSPLGRRSVLRGLTVSALNRWATHGLGLMQSPCGCRYSRAEE